MNIFDKLTSQVTESVSASAKNSAISTLSDPEFKKVVNQFTTEWIYENRIVIVGIFGTLFALTVMASVNIVSNYSSNRG